MADSHFRGDFFDQHSFFMPGQLPHGELKSLVGLELADNFSVKHLLEDIETVAGLRRFQKPFPNFAHEAAPDGIEINNAVIQMGHGRSKERMQASGPEPDTKHAG